uniref:DNA-directed RNA polymerase subunit beta'' n=1 Tax=Dicloster acuatus TaxID=91190 RepID=A0A097KQG3_9CHLO|nr:beta'' subunit of RNA polymerase [Dicloster acuatus]AIT95444.1 beta'' subunit of RNA polymerase [Dicloster acuatus]
MSKSTFRNSGKNYFFNACFDKNQLKSLIGWLMRQYGGKITVDFLETLKQVGFHQATRAGISLGLDDLEIPLQKSFLISQAQADISLFQQQIDFGNLTSVEKFQRMISTWNQTSENLKKMAVQQFKNTNQVNPLYMMAFSGARGNISQVRQLVALRGLMADPQGAILEFPIQSNFREGLTLTEYLISCYGARKGLVDTALRTATSGYLTRRLVDAAQHVIISIKDCKTTQGFLLNNKDLQQHLIGRVLAQELQITETLTIKRNQLLSPTLAKLIAKNYKQVFVRSPLTCQAENSLCQLCYGWNLAHGTLVSIAEAVGVIAAQSIGEPGTQLTMRTFHTGGVGVFSDQLMKYYVSPYDGIIEYSQALPGHFVRTPNGEILYMVKNINTSTQDIILNLKSLQTNKINYSLKKQDLPPGSILVVRQGQRVKAGQLLAQYSQIKKSLQKPNQSSSPVFSPIDGEIYLQCILTFKQLQLSQNKKKVKKTKKKQKEIGPYILTLNGLGTFWVFSGENQKEIHVASTIIRPGDLVSCKSSLFQHNFYVSHRSIFTSILNKPSLGLLFVSLPLDTINFHKVAYSSAVKKSSIFTKQNSITKDFFFFNKKQLENLLIWYPSVSYLGDAGYVWNFLLYSLGKKKKLVNSPSFSNKNSCSNNDFFAGSFFYVPKKIDKLKIHYPLLFKKRENNYFLNLTSSTRKNTTVLLQSHSIVTTISTQPILQNIKELPFTCKKQNFLQKNEKVLVAKSQFFSSTQKTSSSLAKKSSFVNSALKKTKDSLYKNSNFFVGFFQKTKSWVYVPITKKLGTHFKTSKKMLLSQQGKIFDNLLFPNSKICIEKIPKLKIGVIKSLHHKTINNYSLNSWYDWKTFLQQNCLQLKKQNSKNNYFTVNAEHFSSEFSQNFNKCFFYYKRIYGNLFNQKLHQGQNFNNTNTQENCLSRGVTSKNTIIYRPFRKKVKTSSTFQTNSFLIIRPLTEYTLLKNRDLLKQWIRIKKVNNYQLINSRLFTKQKKTIYQKTKITKKFQIIFSKTGGWVSRKPFFKVLINLNSQLVFKKVNLSCLLSTYLKNYKIPIRGINIFFYNFLLLPENSCFYFQVFQDNWVLPSTKISTGFIKIKNYGEFRHFKYIKNTSIICILTTQNIVTLDLSKIPTNTSSDIINLTKNKQIKLGHIIRSGTEIFPNITSSTGGLILNKKFNKFTIRLGIPFLASNRAIFHVFKNDLIQKNDLLVTLKSQRLQTQDIVQGIPKIEQLFEARETQGGTLIPNSIHTRLKRYFLFSLKSEKFSTSNIDTNLAKAVTQSFNKIQYFLVQSILQAYSSQGVNISQKHIEIIVRQMTTRVRILTGGDTGLLPGELIQFTRIQKLNSKLSLVDKRKRPAIYEPIILGITKSVLQSESFLLSASFQEVSRVLVRSALANKKDFLRGLHENVILGQVIPTGTGLVLKTRISPQK